jgi:hypothetical protein
MYFQPNWNEPSMKPTFLPVAVAAMASVVLIGALPAKANEASTNPLADFQQQPSDPFSSRGSDANSGMMDLIHRAMQGPMPDMGAFSAANRESLNDAAAAFRAKQLKAIQARQAAQGLKTVPSGTILLPGALPTAATGTLTPATNIVLPAPVAP